LNTEKLNNVNEKVSEIKSEFLIFFDTFKFESLDIIILISLIFVLFFFLKFFNRQKKIKTSVEKSNLKPVLSNISDNDIEVNKKSEENDFIDVLVAIEEEMAAVRELYVGGYITKGIYISETDRLYEKAKVFGL
tara:strand:+ start:1297 stop:1698 length:402 start_codon:yes stop_codon:yes gene_type:complete